MNSLMETVIWNNATQCIPRTLVPNSIVAAAYGTTDVVSGIVTVTGQQCLPDRSNRQAQKFIAGTSPVAHLLSSSSLIRLCTPTMLQRRRIRSLESTRPHPLFAGLIEAALKRRGTLLIALS